MMMHHLTAFVFALALAAASGEGHAGKDLRDDVIACASQPGDALLSFLQVTDEGHKLGKASLDVIYPPEGEPEYYAVNCIIAKDLKPNTGATATITNGTIGSTRVTIHLESSFTKGLSYSIKLMGQRVRA